MDNELRILLKEAKHCGASRVRVTLPSGSRAVVEFSKEPLARDCDELAAFQRGVGEVLREIDGRPGRLFCETTRLADAWKRIFGVELPARVIGRKVQGWIRAGELKFWTAGKNQRRQVRGFYIDRAFFGTEGQ